VDALDKEIEYLNRGMENPNVKTTVEYINRFMKEGNTELAHMEADRALIAFLQREGYNEVADAWLELHDNYKGFWYG
jgi:hypothetical protein